MSLSNLGYLLPQSKKLFVEIYQIKHFVIDNVDPVRDVFDIKKMNPDDLKIKHFQFSKTIYKSPCNAIEVLAKSFRNKETPFLYININIHNTSTNEVMLEDTVITEKFLEELKKANDFMKSFK